MEIGLMEIGLMEIGLMEIGVIVSVAAIGCVSAGGLG